MMIRCVLFGLFLALPACKTTRPEDTGQSALAALTPGTGMLIVGLDGPHDHGEVNRGVDDGALRCIANANLLCFIAVKAGDLSYKNLSQQCSQHPRCRMFFFRTEDELEALIKAANVKVGLLIGHYTGQGLWDYPNLTPEALDAAASYPLVLRICNSDQFTDGQSGLIPVGTGLLSETDTTYVTVVQALLNQ